MCGATQRGMENSDLLYESKERSWSKSIAWFAPSLSAHDVLGHNKIIGTTAKNTLCVT
jgi:hypothetical protein